MRDFHELKVWEKAHRLAISTYEITHSFPTEERFGLSSQTAGQRCQSRPISQRGAAGVAIRR
jgi:hypothetical protein